jgi:hypothetical protein
MTNDDRSPGERSLEVSDGSNATQPQPHPRSEGDLIGQLTLDYLDLLNGSQGVLPALDDLGTELQHAVLDAWSIVDRLMVTEPLPPLSDDPIAIALGAAPAELLDPTALRAARQMQRRRPSNIANALQRRGWSTTTSDVFRWEQRAEHIAPALLADLASTLNVAAETLMLPGSEAPSRAAGTVGVDDGINPFLQVLYSDELNEIVDQWARLQGISMDAARDDLRQRVNTVAHRGERTLTTRQWKAVLVVLLANERARRGEPNDPITGT